MSKRLWEKIMFGHSRINGQYYIWREEQTPKGVRIIGEPVSEIEYKQHEENNVLPRLFN